MADDVGHSLIDRARDGSARGFRKAHCFGYPTHRATHVAKQFRVTQPLELQY
jgi:hypothetical protein